jgi:hypothetical protein
MTQLIRNTNALPNKLRALALFASLTSIFIRQVECYIGVILEYFNGSNIA